MSLERRLYTLRLRLRSIFPATASRTNSPTNPVSIIDERDPGVPRAQGWPTRGARSRTARVWRGRAAQRRMPRRAPRGLVEESRTDTATAFAHAGAARVTAVAMLSLALGIGANYRHLHPLRCRAAQTAASQSAGRTSYDADRIAPRGTAREVDEHRSLHTVPIARGRRLMFSEVLAFSAVNAPVVTDGTRTLPSQNVVVRLANSSFGSSPGVRTQTGRLFQPEDGPALNQMVVLSDRYWRQEFGADRQIAGRSIMIDGLPRTVIGVTAPEFFGLIVGRIPDYYVPIVEGSPGAARFGVQIVGRLTPGMRDAEASARLTAFTKAHAMMKPRKSCCCTSRCCRSRRVCRQFAASS